MSDPIYISITLLCVLGQVVTGGIKGSRESGQSLDADMSSAESGRSTYIVM